MTYEHSYKRPTTRGPECHLAVWAILALLPQAAIAEESWLVPVKAPGASAAVVSEPASTLIVGCVGDGSGGDSAGGSLLLFKLSDQGVSADEPTVLALDAPAALRGEPLRPVSMAAHPTRPLVYVWVDLDVPDKPRRVGKDIVEAARAQLDHLRIFEFRNGVWAPVMQAAHGDSFELAKPMGSMTLDLDHQRLFLPNLLQEVRDAGVVPVLGYAQLDPSGLPLMNQDGDSSALVLHKQALPRMTNRDGWPWGLVAPSRDVVIYGTARGLANCNFVDAQQQYSEVLFSKAAHHCTVSAHPTQPIVYAAPLGTQTMYCMEHAGGYLTMLPRSVELPHARVTSSAIPLPHRSVVAVGMLGWVALIPIDEAGRFVGTPEMVRFRGGAVRAMAYSKRLDQLLVPVENAR